MQRSVPRTPLRFSTQTLLLQLGVVLLVVLLSAAVHAWLTYDRVGSEAENQALTLARTVASDPEVARRRAGHQRRSRALPRRLSWRPVPCRFPPKPARTRTGALFVVITDEDGPPAGAPGPRAARRKGQHRSVRGPVRPGSHHPEHRNAGRIGRSEGSGLRPGQLHRGGRGQRGLLDGNGGPERGPGHRPRGADRRRRPAGRHPGLLPAAPPAAAAHAGAGTGGDQHAGPRPGGSPPGRGRRRHRRLRRRPDQRLQRRRAAPAGAAGPGRHTLGGRPGAGPADRPDPARTGRPPMPSSWWPAAGCWWPTPARPCTGARTWAGW